MKLCPVDLVVSNKPTELDEGINCNFYPISFHYSFITYLIPRRAAESHILNFTESPLRASLTAAEVYFIVS